MTQPQTRAKAMADQLRICFGKSSEEIATVCEVDIATARRWKRGATSASPAALMLLSRDLGCLDPAWRGWTIRDSQIISPEGWTVSRNDALSVPLLHSQIAMLRQDLAKALAELQALKRAPEADDQPLPSQWTIAIKTA